MADSVGSQGMMISSK